VCIGGTLVLTVGASATTDAQYQWLVNGVEIPAATTNRLEIADFTAGRAGSYACRVSTSCGTATSDVAVIGTRPTTEITQQPPASIDVVIGQPLVISVTASGAGTVQYQWVKDGADIASAVAPTYSRAAAATDDAGRYWCRVTSECGTITSDTTTVTTRPVVSVDEEVMAGGIVVSTVRPQPASTTAAFTVSLPTRADVRVVLIDMAGRVIATFMDQSVEAGVTHVDLDISNIATGSYALVTIVGDARMVSNMTIVK
jgi:hypothetical protein